MPVLTDPRLVREAFETARRRRCPLLCPNAETPDEMEGVLLAAADHATACGQEQVAVGVGITATYPDHPQLGHLCSAEEKDGPRIEETARLWCAWLEAIARQSRFDRVAAIPFLDHGWAVHEADRHLMKQRWFQKAMGIILFDASALEFDENRRLTADYVASVEGRVLVEGCPDKVYERAELERKGLSEADLLSDPDQVETFVRETGVDLVVPNLGTEHRSGSGEPLRYQEELARDLAGRIGPRLALHGTSSLGGRLGTVGRDGICKINYYTAMAREASTAVREAWAETSGSLAIDRACGSFLHRTRREAVRRNLRELFTTITSSAC